MIIKKKKKLKTKTPEGEEQLNTNKTLQTIEQYKKKHRLNFATSLNYFFSVQIIWTTR